MMNMMTFLHHSRNLYKPNRAGVRLGVMGASSFRPGVQIFTDLLRNKKDCYSGVIICFFVHNNDKKYFCHNETRTKTVILHHTVISKIIFFFYIFSLPVPSLLD